MLSHSENPIPGSPTADVPQELTLYPSRRSWILISLMSLGFCLASYLVIPISPFMGWTGLGLFGVCSVGCSMPVLFPGLVYLRLTSEGFYVRSLFRTQFTRWTDVTPFSVDVMRLNSFVCYSFSRVNAESRFAGQIAHDFSGWESALPDNYGLSAEELAMLMNEWKWHCTTALGPTRIE